MSGPDLRRMVYWWVVVAVVVMTALPVSSYAQAKQRERITDFSTETTAGELAGATSWPTAVNGQGRVVQTQAERDGGSIIVAGSQYNPLDLITRQNIPYDELNRQTIR